MSERESARNEILQRIKEINPSGSEYDFREEEEWLVLSAGMRFKIGGFRDGKRIWSGSSNEKQGGYLVDDLLAHCY